MISRGIPGLAELQKIFISHDIVEIFLASKQGREKERLPTRRTGREEEDEPRYPRGASFAQACSGWLDIFGRRLVTYECIRGIHYLRSFMQRERERSSSPPYEPQRANGLNK